MNLCEIQSYINAKILRRTWHQLVATSVRSNQLENNMLESIFGPKATSCNDAINIGSLLVYNYSKIYSRFFYIQRNSKL